MLQIKNFLSVFEIKIVELVAIYRFNCHELDQISSYNKNSWYSNITVKVKNKF